MIRLCVVFGLAACCDYLSEVTLARRESRPFDIGDHYKYDESPKEKGCPQVIEFLDKICPGETSNAK